ncbi:MAG: hypothetical protein KF847_07885 [Pirellulales bacterium]|nr:hypothetical protein [Pirellulales bacterium]
MNRGRRRVWIAGACLLAAGCGQGGIPMVSVSGKVTYNGGEWPAAGSITFTPLETVADYPRRSGSGGFGADGKFVVGSFKSNDGLVPGTYGVSVGCMKERDLTTPIEQLNYVPAGFKPNAGPVKDGVLVVEAGSRAIEVNFDVPAKANKR